MRPAPRSDRVHGTHGTAYGTRAVDGARPRVLQLTIIDRRAFSPARVSRKEPCACPPVNRPDDQKIRLIGTSVPVAPQRVFVTAYYERT